MKQHNLGMTLIELLITLSVGAVLMSFAVPSYQVYVSDARVSSATSLFVAHLNTARSEAVTRGEPVALCASEDELTCSDSTAWASGWIVFTDSDGDPGVRDGTDKLVLVGRPQGESLSLEAGGTYVRFGTLGAITTD